MAKAKAKAPAKKVSKKISFKPRAADYKFIGASFDRTIEALQEVRTIARSNQKSLIDDEITSLQDLKGKVRLRCRQGWFISFDID